ncbi:pullulanase-type alpha-1,6-glucosidase [Luteimicrobium subarcticum]|uniref:Pullulanase-type alpha-1,6-glucosidase n=1 Tax=Luteimicrobium subarcticum TaxID=620910 RepID=A0A2M8WT18_9MICO|nr:pullulanase-type alpha-1,6-glucosidase [Luteimicrobium subarcticum]PJI94073.1 pullulanase-type alpha-1,6-glucosidase [Luteimicrobium subarcticum]
MSPARPSLTPPGTSPHPDGPARARTPLSDDRTAAGLRTRRLTAVLAGAALAVSPVLPAVAGAAAASADALLVTVPGSHQTEMGCASDWDPSCTASALAQRPDGDYSADFTIPAGSYDYKVAVGGTWDENYGAGGAAGGANISYTTSGGTVGFFYDPATHYAQSTASGPIVTAAGSFQSELGCSGDWAPDCLRSWLQDPDGDGVYTFTTTALPTGSYEVKATEGLGWDVNYGEGGAPGGANIAFSATAGKATTFAYDAATHVLTVTVADPPLPGTGQQRAQWVDATTLAWPAALLGGGEATDPSQQTWALHTAPTGGVSVQDGAVSLPDDGASYGLVRDARGLTAKQLKRFPALAGYTALHPVDSRGHALSRSTVERVLRGQLAVSQASADGTLSAFTGVQVPGVLDDLYAARATQRTLGATWTDQTRGPRGTRTTTPDLAVWAPTARDVDLLLWDAGATGEPRRVPAVRRSDGAWTVHGAPSWQGKEYLWDVRVYVPGTGTVEDNQVTDPYSVALTTGSTRTVLVDLDDPALAPKQWRTTASPTIDDPAQRTIYELSVRDFSATDTTVPAALRGTYDAFATSSAGTKHLRDLAAAGLNTVHLQPTFDFSSVPEDRAAQRSPDCDLASYPADSDQQQTCVTAVAADDAFNWGYDPLHYAAPEGSYAVHPDGASRTTEFRTMVGALHADGLQVVLDQVFNHTSAAGQDARSVLDRVVPGYYQRLDANGNVYTATCCSDTATEHAMMNKLMVDSVVLWAKEYRVDGFRFDLMAFHSVQTMTDVRKALDRLTLRRDGVDGKAVYLYGEGWNFGEVADDALFTQASQGQLGGTGIGTFSDRLRDAVRGGSPVDSSTVRQQGYGSGLAGAPNGDASNGDAAAQAARLGHDEDLVKLGLAGNLADFSFTTSDGTVKKGSAIDYDGQPAGYADEPDEVVSYVDAHDNQSLFDTLTTKLPQSTTMADRVRMQDLSLATATLSQSPSLWLAGSDLLRSKSLDGNSYDSGDWFNAIDWSGRTNGFAKGLPPEADNGAQWPLMKTLLADPALDPAPADIARSTAVAQDVLRLKRSTDLFSLGSAAQIEKKVTFPVTSTPGVVTMRIDDTRGKDADRALDGVLVVFNAGTTTATERVAGLAGTRLTLSPVQARGADPVVRQTTWDDRTGTVTVPARSFAVLVQPSGRR